MWLLCVSKGLRSCCNSILVSFGIFRYFLLPNSSVKRSTMLKFSPTVPPNYTYTILETEDNSLISGHTALLQRAIFSKNSSQTSI